MDSFDITDLTNGGDYSLQIAGISYPQKALSTLNNRAGIMNELRRAMGSIFNANNRIVIEGNIFYTNESILAVWSSTDVPNLVDVATTSITRTFSNGTSLFSISIPPFTLTAGFDYLFTLSAKYVSQPSSATSSIMIITNDAPIGGIVSVAPTVGVALLTAFTINTYSWSDSGYHYPLTYLISYYTSDLSTQYSLKYDDTVPYVGTVLGQGIKFLLYEVTCVATATDSLGAYANATKDITVNPNMNIYDLTSYIQNKLSIALSSSQPYVVNQLSSAAALSLNAVNCTVMQPCSNLYRYPCAAVSHTCGKCLPGYGGEDGDSNNRCNLTSTISISRK
jgi:hypothetical protein